MLNRIMLAPVSLVYYSLTLTTAGLVGRMLFALHLRTLHIRTPPEHERSEIPNSNCQGA